ncbi:Uncharacterised protein [Vibrio cholerae]|nr:Uncharacterised protein [Vibrio cholerae]
MVNQIPVRSWLTKTNIASEPNRYQKLKFFGIGYSERCFLYAFMAGRRFSTQSSRACIMPPLSHQDQSRSAYH